MSLQGSKSTIYGSLKSSRSSATVFGSCISAIGSSTNTIGSFHTARSCSTIYFSAKEEEDSNTLNWTMNYDSFDELSDTSTLVGEEEEDHLVTSASEIRMDIRSPPEAENQEAQVLMEAENHVAFPIKAPSITRYKVVPIKWPCFMQSMLILANLFW